MTGWAERARLGERLAHDAGEPNVDGRLLDLLLDPDDTGVTYRTALALLERRDRAGLALIVEAYSGADGNTGQWLADAFLTYRAESTEPVDEHLRSTLESIASTSGPPTRAAVDELLSHVFGTVR